MTLLNHQTPGRSVSVTEAREAITDSALSRRTVIPTAMLERFARELDGRQQPWAALTTSPKAGSIVATPTGMTALFTRPSGTSTPGRPAASDVLVSSGLAGGGDGSGLAQVGRFAHLRRTPS